MVAYCPALRVNVVAPVRADMPFNTVNVEDEVRLKVMVPAPDPAPAANVKFDPHPVDPASGMVTVAPDPLVNSLVVRRSIVAVEESLQKLLIACFRALGPGGQPVKVLYHSHLDVGAYFSATDAAAATFGGDEPPYALAYLVTSVRGSHPGDPAAVVDDHKLYVWDGAKRSFVESAFSVVGRHVSRSTPARGT